MSGDRKPYEERPSFIAERQADDAFTEGRFEHALQTLRTANMTFDEIQDEHFYKMKEIAAPLYVAFYELSTAGDISADTREDMQDVHAYVVEAMQDDLKKYLDADKVDKSLYRGGLSEKVIFALGARGFNNYGRRFILPASAEANVDKKRPTDFYAVTLPHRSNKYRLIQQPVQVKTTIENSGAIEKGVSIVGLRQIDSKGPRGRTNLGYPIDHADAMPAVMIREIDGTASNGEINRLNYVTQRMYRHIFPPVKKVNVLKPDGTERAAS